MKFYKIQHKFSKILFYQQVFFSYLGSQLQRTPLAGQDRPDMCSPDTVTTVLTSAILQNPFILDYFRTMGATGTQVHVS